MSIDKSVARKELPEHAASAANGESPTASAEGTSGTAAAGSSPVPKRRRKWRFYVIGLLLLSAVGGFARWKFWEAETQARFEAMAGKAQTANILLRFEDYQFPAVAKADNAAPLLFWEQPGFLGAYDPEPHSIKAAQSGVPLNARELAAADAALRKSMPIIYEASRRRQYVIRFDLSMQQGLQQYWQADAPRCAAARASEVDCVVGLQTDDPARAYASLIAALRLELQADGPLQWKRSWFAHHHVRLLELLLADQLPDDAAFADLDAALQQTEAHIRARPDLEYSYLHWSAALDTVGTVRFEKVCHSLLPGGRSVVSVSSRDVRLRACMVRVYESRLLTPAVPATKAALLKRIMELGPWIDVPGAEATAACNAILQSPFGEGDELTFFGELERALLSSPYRLMAMRGRQRVICARLALRAARYQRDHGQWPETLQQLTDAALPEVPPDLLSGQPLEMITDGERLIIQPQNMAAFARAPSETGPFIPSGFTLATAAELHRWQAAAGFTNDK